MAHLGNSPRDSPVEYRLLSLADVEPAAQVIAQAFFDDPLITTMLPRKSSRMKTLLRLFRFYGEINIKSGRGYGAGEPLQGVAFWQMPGQGDLSVSVKSLGKLLGKLLPLLFTPYLIAYYRASRPTGVLPQVDALHKKYAPGPHYYLDNLGVLPAAQGRGYASKLLRPILARAAEEHVVVYTDTFTRSNVSLYEHFGFELVEERPIAGMSLTLFALRKIPA
jgi:acetyltransferase (GNAT) family protein